MNKSTPPTRSSYGIDEVIQPILEISDANRQAFEKITALQTEFLSHNFDAGLQQWQHWLSNATDPTAYAETKIDYYHALEQEITDTSEQEYQAIHLAYDRISQVLTDNYKNQSRFFNAFFPFPNSPINSQ